MKEFRLIVFFILMLPLSGFSQQLPQIALHMFNQTPLNPAYTGIENHLLMGISHRSQWGGFEGAPRTQHFFAHGRVKDKNFGLGGYFFNDKTGPLRNTGLNASYAYHLPLNSRQTVLSMGLSSTVGQFSIIGSEILLDNEVDNLIDLNSTSSQLVAEFGTGVVIHNPKYSFGFAAQQLLNSNKEIFPATDGNGTMKNVGHYYITGSYIGQLDDDIAFIPSLFVNMAQNNPTQIDMNLRVALSSVQFGLGYRTNDALVALLNFNIGKFLDLSYTYDFQTTTLNQYNKGSHEVLLRYRIFYDELGKKAFLLKKEQE